MVRKQHYGKKLQSLSFHIVQSPFHRVLSKSFWLSGFLQFDARFHYDDESTLNVDFPQYSQYSRTEWFSSLNILT